MLLKKIALWLKPRAKTKEDLTETHLQKKGFKVEPLANKGVVEGYKRQYSIVGDAFYTKVNSEYVPPWLAQLVERSVATQFANASYDYKQLVADVRGAIDSLKVAENTFTSEIVKIKTANEALVSKIETSNASLSDELKAEIVTINNTYASENETLAQKITDLTSKFNNNDARITSLNNAFTDEQSSVASSINALETSYQGAQSSISTVRNESINRDKSIENKFEYGSDITIDGKTYSSGFGLRAEAGEDDNSQVVHDSEFWINAEKFKFTYGDETGSVTPFEIDSSGPNPVIKFLGEVTFEDSDNISHTSSTLAADDQQFDPDPPAEGSTHTQIVRDPNTNEVTDRRRWKYENGAWGEYPVPDNATMIQGSMVTTGIVNADLLRGNIDAGLITAGSIKTISLAPSRTPSGAQTTYSVLDKAGLSVYEDGKLRVRVGEIDE